MMTRKPSPAHCFHGWVLLFCYLVLVSGIPQSVLGLFAQTEGSHLLGLAAHEGRLELVLHHSSTSGEAARTHVHHGLTQALVAVLGETTHDEPDHFIPVPGTQANLRPDDGESPASAANPPLVPPALLTTYSDPGQTRARGPSLPDRSPVPATSRQLLARWCRLLV